jgi:replicative DNA helicase
MDERALISFAMKDVNFYYDIKSNLSSSDFLCMDHQTLMIIMDTLMAKGSHTLDLSLIVGEAQSNHVVEQVGGIGYVQSINNMMVSDKNFEVYLNNVIDSTLKYKLYMKLQDNLQELIENAKEGKTASDILCAVENDIFNLSIHNQYISEPKDLAVGLDEFFKERKDNYIEMSGLDTGFPILNKQIDGLIPGTLLILASRMKMGKSALLTNIALHIAYRLKKTVLYIDTELSFNEWRTRALARMCNVTEREIKHGGYTDEVYNKIGVRKKLIKEGLLFHEYMPGYSVDKVVSLCKKYKLQKDLGLIVFDYLKEPDSSSLDRQRKEHQILGDVTTKLKDLSGQLDIPAVTAVQLNRDHNIADSDRVARYGDIIAFWDTRKKEEIEAGGLDCGSHKLWVKDTRRGGATREEGIGYYFFKDYLKIKEVSPDKQYFINVKDGVVNADSANGYQNQELR